MTTFNGYTKDLTPSQKRANEIATIEGILESQPTNEFWLSRLAVLTKEETCRCYLYMGDNKDCPDHGHFFKDHGAINDMNNIHYSDDEIKADYQGCNDLYLMGMGG